jgi:diacylglycerol kinase family enzyme
MAIVPMGTANNVARSLGLGVDPHVAVRDLSRATERRIDLGIVTNDRSKDYFVEGFGLGIFAHVLAERARKKDKKPSRALELIADELEAYQPLHVELDVGGRDFSGMYMLAAVMNARSLGPALRVAPDARCDDGELDVVLVRPEAKVALVKHLRRAAVEVDVALPAFESIRAKQIRVRADGRWVHVDDTARQLDGAAVIDIAAGAVRLFAPPLSPKPAHTGH